MDRSPTWASHLRDALHPYSLTARSPPCSDIRASFVRVRAETNWVCRPRNRRIRDHYALSRASGSAGSPRCPQDPKSSKRVGLTRRSRCNPAHSALSSPAVDPLEERIRVRQRAASALAQGRLAKLPQAVALLRGLGAERVWLFGSLSTGAVHEGSDVDFMVSGLPASERTSAWLDLEALFGTPVDLVPEEAASSEFRQAVHHNGRDITSLGTEHVAE